jgi:UDP-4-amino-4-deoxy-L-arabinose formyltransferase/UDP-glucuronic acid dehydrogenase (UDP-4-keto-hexauronic acid decarboxylating)
MMLEALDLLQKDPHYVLEVQSKNEADALRCYPRNPGDGRITWSHSAEQIIRLINASSEPFAGAFCTYDDKTCIIWRAELYTDNENYLAVPGQVCAIREGAIIVITGKGKIRITEIEIEGNRCTPDTLIKSIRKRLT